MAKIMLIDATHPEETRVAVADGRKLEEFDVEIAGRRPLKGNIYLAKVTRVEPSLQAAFVEYGGNRHGFLAFSEIHPDYYRIPVADREALLRSAREDDEPEGAAELLATPDTHADDGVQLTDAPQSSPHFEGTEAEDRLWAEDEEAEKDPASQPDIVDQPGEAPASDTSANAPDKVPTAGQSEESASGEMIAPWEGGLTTAALETPRIELRGERIAATSDEASDPNIDEHDDLVGAVASETNGAAAEGELQISGDSELPAPGGAELVEVPVPEEVVEMLGGEEPAPQDDPELDEERARRRRQRNLRRYKIQEVIKRRQILLVQVTKEERGNKGAALTTYLSLAGRYCVLMPNTDRGGGISRRITSANDRKRLKSIIDDLDVPEGMAIIVRTAGMERSKAEIGRDFEYLLRLWDEIRETTLQSTAPALIYEEASLIKRSIRDLYTRDIGDIMVAGSEAYSAARAFMRTLTPGHLKRIQLYRDSSVPLFQRYQIEGQIAAIHEPVVQLRSGGYVVINQTEALVAIDVNSGRSTRERNIEETALRTNLEAADEIARQLRLRDLAGLIVIDFIDMEENRNNSAVERRLKEALKNDRARIQIGRISTFGLLEMSRQRLHPSLVEASTEICPHCGGAGRVRSVDSTSLHVLRMVEEEISRQHSPGVTVSVPAAVALYILNQKRAALSDIENRRGVRIYVQADESLTPPDFRVERIKQLGPGEEVVARSIPMTTPAEPEEEEVVPEDELVEGELEPTPDLDGEMAAADAAPRNEEAKHGRKRRRRRGRGGRLRADEFTEAERLSPSAAPAMAPAGDAAVMISRPANDTEAGQRDVADDEVDDEGRDRVRADQDSEGAGQDQRRRRRRGRRGGRRRQRRGQSDEATDAREGFAAPAEPQVPGLGDQPTLPDEMPRDWRPANGERGGGNVPIGEPGSSEGLNVPTASNTGEDSPSTRPRRARRPRRNDDSVHSENPAAGGEAIDTGTAPAPAKSSAGGHHGERAVRTVEIRNPDQAPAPNEDGPGELKEKKRGWWRRLME